MAIGTRDLVAATTIWLAVLLLFFVPTTAATVPSIDATLTRHLPLPRGLLRGPESVAFDAKGQGPYSGVSDGRILKWNGDKIGWTTYAYGPDYSSEACTATVLRPETATESHCGRPLGLRFHLKSGYLYIADAYKGLMRVGPGGGKATVLVTEVDGAPLRFTNGVDVDQVTGEVYFTDSSMTYQRSQHEMVTRTGDSTGRLMRYDPRTGRVVLLKAGITYPNGLALSADRTHLVISSTGPCKLLRYWIKGPKAGRIELLADLPGYPDNVRPDKRGGYWVALHREKTELPFGVDSHLLALRVGADGKIVEESSLFERRLCISDGAVVSMAGGLHSHRPKRVFAVSLRYPLPRPRHWCSTAKSRTRHTTQEPWFHGLSISAPPARCDRLPAVSQDQNTLTRGDI